MPYPNPEYFGLMHLLEKLRAGDVPSDLDSVVLEHALLTQLQETIGEN